MSGDFERGGALAVAVSQPASGEILDDLVAANLLQYDEITQRFHLYGLLREYASARLASSDRYMAEHRHADYYAQLLVIETVLYRAGDPHLQSALALFDKEQAHIRAGQQWAEANTGTDIQAAKLSSVYGEYPYILGLRLHPQEEIRWLQAALSAARQLQDRRVEGVHLGNLASVYRVIGNLSEAIEYTEQAIQIARDIGDRPNEGREFGWATKESPMFNWVNTILPWAFIKLRWI